MTMVFWRHLSLQFQKKIYSNLNQKFSNSQIYSSFKLNPLQIGTQQTPPYEVDVGNNHLELGKQMWRSKFAKWFRVALDDLWFIFYGSTLSAGKKMDGKACLHGLFYVKSYWLVNKKKQGNNFDFLITLGWKIIKL